MSKQLFELMQQQQIAEAFPTKKQVQSNALQFVNNLIQSGEIKTIEREDREPIRYLKIRE